MELKDYIKGKKSFFIIYLLFLIISAPLFIYFKINVFFIIYFYFILLFLFLFYFIKDYKNKKEFYSEINNIIDNSDCPYSDISEVISPDFFEGNILLNTASLCSESLTNDLNICFKENISLREFVMKVLQDNYNLLIQNKIATAIKNLEININEDKILLYFYINTVINYITKNKQEKTFIKFYSDNKDDIYQLIIETNVEINNEDYYIEFLKKLSKSMHTTYLIEKDKTNKIILILN